MRNTGLIAFMASQTWALHRPVLDAAREVIARHAGGDRLDDGQIAVIVEERDRRRAARDAAAGGTVADAAAEAAGYSMDGAVAVVGVDGVLCKYASMINGMSQPQGMTSAEVAAAVTAAANDPRTKAVLLNIDSPGGTVAGVSDMVDAVNQVTASGMPVVAMAHDMAASAAYWLACAADSIYLTPMADVGSIGVYTVLEDSSRAAANKGSVTHVISDGVDKGVGVDGAPVTASQMETIRQGVQAVGRQFRAAVAESRGLTPAAVEKVATGRTFLGQQAVDAGLADGVTTFRELVAMMNRKVAGK